MSNKEYEHAFPTIDDNYDPKYSGPGMTLRDYFAAKAMQGVFASGAEISLGPSRVEEMEGMAKTFYLMADAMLRTREAS
ncbi:hypothetical protein [Kluyvera genomosp. 1]|uniref:hypothetical protein n=1 Tax=Kluyvera genomosp. 1 TaxID=2774053 RepID=UPI00069073B8|nr:hypothetical protein [Kluyvera genomosp. 1]